MEHIQCSDTPGNLMDVQEAQVEAIAVIDDTKSGDKDSDLEVERSDEDC